MKTKPPGSAAARACTRTARGAERVRQLQDTAAEMFLSCGYEGVSVDGLIHRVGGSRRNVYGVYGGKEGLFVAAVRGLCEEIAEQLALLRLDEADTRSGLQLYGCRLLQLVLQPRLLAMHRLMVAEGQRFPEQAHALCSSSRDRAAAALGLWFATRQARGEIRADLAALRLAQQFIDLVVAGPQVRALVGELPPGWTAAGIQQHVEFTVELFIGGAGTNVGTNAGKNAAPSLSLLPHPQGEPRT